MKYSNVIEKVENLLSQNDMSLLRIEVTTLTTSQDERLSPGEYFIADLRVAIPITQGK